MVRCERVELLAQEGVLFGEVLLERLYVCEMIGKVLDGCRVLYERVRDGPRIRGGRIERYGGRSNSLQCLLAFGSESGFNVREKPLVIFIRYDLPL